MPTARAFTAGQLVWWQREDHSPPLPAKIEFVGRKWVYITTFPGGYAEDHRVLPDQLTPRQTQQSYKRR